MMTKGWPIGKATNKTLRLLNCNSEAKGKIALAMWPCQVIHFAVRTEGFQHPQCVEMVVTGYGHTVVEISHTREYSRCYKLIGGAGTLNFGVRWSKGHSPYPEIQGMDIWAFNIYLGYFNFPKAPDDYMILASIDIMSNGRVYVNGIDAGIWPEFIQPSQETIQ